MRENNITILDAKIAWSKMSLQNVTGWGPSRNFSEIGPCSFRAQMLADPTEHRPTRADERATSGRRAGDEQATTFSHWGSGLDQRVYHEQKRRRHIYMGGSQIAPRHLRSVVHQARWRLWILCVSSLSTLALPRDFLDYLLGSWPGISVYNVFSLYSIPKIRLNKTLA